MSANPKQTEDAVTPPSGLRSLAGDSGALLLSNAAFLVTGLLRTKLSAVALGPAGLGIVSQLTQLSMLIVFVSAVGLGPGMRLAFARPTLTGPEKASAGKGLLTRVLIVALGASAVASVFAAQLADLLLESASLNTELRIALLTVLPSTTIQVLLPIAQAAAEFRRIAAASLASAVLGIGVTLPILLTESVLVAVATIPAAAVLQLSCLSYMSPTIRQTILAPVGRVSALTREILSVGIVSFFLGLASLLGETAIRILMVERRGVEFVAGYQPIYLLSSSTFGMLLGAISTALMVHITRDLSPGSATTSRERLNHVLQRALVLVGGLGFAVQIGLMIYIPLVFSAELIGSGPAIAFQVPVEMLRATVYILGAALLPLSMRRAWLVAGLATVLCQVTVVFLALEMLGLKAVPVASGVGWLVGLSITLYALSRAGIRVSRRSSALLVWTVSLQLVAAWSVQTPAAIYAPLLGPTLIALVWMATIAIAVRHLMKRSDWTTV